MSFITRLVFTLVGIAFTALPIAITVESNSPDLVGPCILILCFGLYVLKVSTEGDLK